MTVDECIAQAQHDRRRATILEEYGIDIGPEPERRAIPKPRPKPHPICDFCKGEPVGNAAAWFTLDAPATAPCPRCGRHG